MFSQSFALKRCTALWFRCGVFFFGLIAVGCNGTAPEAGPVRDVLRVGYPEGVTGGPNVGVGELVRGQALESLIQLAPDGRTIPELAERWTWQNDGRRLRVTLRPGVLLHDGTPFTASLAATILQQTVERPGNRILYASYGDITQITHEGDRDVIFDLSRQSGFLPEDLDVLLGVGPDNVGTGPYRVTTREPKKVVLERFDQYYLGAPRIRQMVVTPFETLRTAWTSLLRGDLDMVTDVPPDAVEFIGNEDVQVISFPRRYQYLIAFNSRQGALKSPAVRRALNFAIDRNALIKTVLQGRATTSSGPLWPRYWAYDTSVEPYDFDPALAASILDQAGFTPGKAAGVSDVANARLRFTCLIPAGFSIWERVALEVQKNLYNIGVDMQFEVVPFQEFDARMREARFDAALNNIISGPTPARAYIFWQSARRYKGLNVFGYENPEAERLFEVLRSTINEGAVRSATSRLQTVLMEDPPALFLAWDQRSRAVSRDFQVDPDTGEDPMLTMSQWTPVARSE